MTELILNTSATNDLFSTLTALSESVSHGAIRLFQSGPYASYCWKLMAETELNLKVMSHKSNLYIVTC